MGLLLSFVHAYFHPNSLVLHLLLFVEVPTEPGEAALHGAPAGGDGV